MNCARPTGYPRNVRKNLRRIEAAISTLEQAIRRPPREQELADTLGVTLEEYQTMLLESRGYQLLHYEDFQESEDSDFFDVYVSDHRPDHWTYWRMSVSGGSSCTPSARCRSARRS